MKDLLKVPTQKSFQGTHADHSTNHTDSVPFPEQFTKTIFTLLIVQNSMASEWSRDHSAHKFSSAVLFLRMRPEADKRIKRTQSKTSIGSFLDCVGRLGQFCSGFVEDRLYFANDSLSRNFYGTTSSCACCEVIDGRCVGSEGSSWGYSPLVITI